MTFSAGSIRDLVYSGINPFPSSISGVLVQLVNNAIFRVENFAGATLGTTSIADRYQPAITNFATSNVLKLMAVQENGVQFVSIGDLATNNNNLKEMAAMFEEMGKMDLVNLTGGKGLFKVRG